MILFHLLTKNMVNNNLKVQSVVLPIENYQELSERERLELIGDSMIDTVDEKLQEYSAEQMEKFKNKFKLHAKSSS